MKQRIFSSLKKIQAFPWSYQYFWKRSFLGGSARYPRSFKATAGCTTEAVRSLKWRAVDCPNSSWKSIATPENLFANAAWNRRLTEYRVPWKNLFDSEKLKFFVTELTYRYKSVEQDFTQLHSIPCSFIIFFFHVLWLGLFSCCILKFQIVHLIIKHLICTASVYSFHLNKIYNT